MYTHAILEIIILNYDRSWHACACCTARTQESGALYLQFLHDVSWVTYEVPLAAE